MREKRFSRHRWKSFIKLKEMNGIKRLRGKDAQQTTQRGEHFSRAVGGALDADHLVFDFHPEPTLCVETLIIPDSPHGQIFGTPKRSDSCSCMHIVSAMYTIHVCSAKHAGIYTVWRCFMHPFISNFRTVLSLPSYCPDTLALMICLWSLVLVCKKRPQRSCYTMSLASSETQMAARERAVPFGA